MFLTTKHLLLRPLGVFDLKTVHEYASDIDNTKYMLFFPKDTEEETKNFLIGVEEEWKKDNPEFFEFAIVLDNVQIGAVSLYLDETKEQGELGWILNKKYWNKGYTTEAAAAAIAFAKDTLHLKKLFAYCDHRNIASIKVMEKIGMNLACDNGTRTYLKRKETARELFYTISFLTGR